MDVNGIIRLLLLNVVGIFTVSCTAVGPLQSSQTSKNPELEPGVAEQLLYDFFFYWNPASRDVAMMEKPNCESSADGLIYTRRESSDISYAEGGMGSIKYHVELHCTGGKPVSSRALLGISGYDISCKRVSLDSPFVCKDADDKIISRWSCRKDYADFAFALDCKAVE